MMSYALEKKNENLQVLYSRVVLLYVEGVTQGRTSPVLRYAVLIHPIKHHFACKSRKLHLRSQEWPSNAYYTTIIIYTAILKI